jgi:hypothetical protein
MRSYFLQSKRRGAAGDRDRNTRSTEASKELIGTRDSSPGPLDVAAATATGVCARISGAHDAHRRLRLV